MPFQPTNDTWTHPRPVAETRAGFWKRFSALLIDGVLLIITTAILEAIIHTAGDVLAFLIWIAYFTACEGGLSGQTLGARVMQTRVISISDGQPIGYQRAFIRTLGRILAEIPLFLGYLWMLWNPENQTWHDKLAHSTVVMVRPEPSRPGAPW